MGESKALTEAVTPSIQSRPQRAIALRVAPLVVGGLVLLLAVYAWVSGAARYVESADPYPGVGTAVADVVGNFAGFALAAVVLGGLVSVVLTAVPDSQGFIDAAVYPVFRRVRRAAGCSVIVAVLMAFTSAADTTGVSVGAMVSSGKVGYAFSVSLPALAWLVVAAAGVVVLIGSVSLRWSMQVALVVPAAVCVLALPVVGNAAQGPDHDYTTGAVIVFAVSLALSVGLRWADRYRVRGLGSATIDEAANRRVGYVVLGADVSALVGAVAVTLLLRTPDVWSSAFGRATGLLVAVLAVLVVADLVRLRRGVSTSETSVLAASTALVAVACWAVMDTRVAPGLIAHPFTAWDVYLGYSLPGPPDVGSLVSLWRVDLVVGVAAVVGVVGYLVAARRERASGHRWPIRRTVSWVAGCAVVVVSTSSGLKAYGNALFSVHMAEHTGLTMIAPILLVGGAPITLLLRVLPTTGTTGGAACRRALLIVLSSRGLQLLLNPIAAFALFVGSSYLVYFTPAFDVLVRYHWGHVVMSVLFLATGYLFFWVTVGIDPGPKQLPFLARLGLLFAVMPFHAFFGIALMTSTTVIGESFYSQLQLPWNPDLARTQWVGGVVAAVISEIPMVLVCLVLLAQWVRAERRPDRSESADIDAGTSHTVAAMVSQLAQPQPLSPSAVYTREVLQTQAVGDDEKR
ncbi:cytochrome c oxidase assembly protein (plasmid) [Gordonia rubripertincta]|uniref:Cytochrome c oxidase assembly protein n=1 Tax=Gordonia rubripertincta TaxID=36822 RepID=A0AAW6RGK7_GORRU|nr:MULTISPECIES: cytochrome c oxidase assembly protein [Gordonia]MDG6783147.1 cytochrome c oxidase assembly protein [Gordonia rubripertincta]NKY65442.1 cytochrome c oxidase assembly protein [Gordonia rubripertincta]